MSFSKNVVEDILLIKVNGPRATVELSSEFKKELKDEIKKGNVNIVVDLSDAEFMDSSFLGALVTGLKQSRMKNGEIKIVGLRPEVYALFELTRMNKVFDIYPSVAETLKAFKNE